MTEAARRDLALWTGLLTGPAIWFASLEAKFAIAPWICVFGWKPAAYLVSALALAITGGAGLLSWMQWRTLAGQPPVSRPRAMAAAGILLSVGFMIVLVAQTLPEFLLAGCE